MPFVVCAEDWLRARLSANDLTHSTRNDEQPGTGQASVLVIHGKTSALELAVLPDNILIDADQPFDKLDHCEYLDAPMASGEYCLIRTVPGPDL